MSRVMGLKISSRAGRFKKKLVSSEVLLIEAGPLEAKLAPLVATYKSGQLSASEFTAAYLITILSHRNPGTWAGAKRAKLNTPHHMPTLLKDLPLKFEPNIQRRLEGITNLGDLFAQFAFKSTPEAVNRAILAWSHGDYRLELMFRIPTPQEVLDQQKQGRRCVTAIVQATQLKKYILGQRDALSFTMHDLIHADHFYHHNDSFQSQLGLYALLDFCMKQNHFEEHLKLNKFQDEFEYLIADMNAYAVHLLKCLKSALIFYHPEGENFFANWVLKITTDQNEQDALLELNTQTYDEKKQDAYLLKLLERYKLTRPDISPNFSHSH